MFCLFGIVYSVEIVHVFGLKTKHYFSVTRSVSILGLKVKFKPGIGPNYLDCGVIFSSMMEPNIPSEKYFNFI